MTEEVEEKPIPRKTPEEITTLAREIVTNQVFIAVTEEALSMAFPILTLWLPSVPDWKVEQMGAVYEYYDQAGERSCNGYPMFMSCKIVHTDDVEFLHTEIYRLLDALGIEHAQ